MPNRIIKDSIHTSEKVNSMTDFQFRVWVSLITYVDDYGRGDARIPVIRGQCFPLRERITNKDLEIALRHLAGIGCIRFYNVDGRPYLYFPNWESHQTIRNHKSKFPAPPPMNSDENNCEQMNSNVPVIQSNPIQSESESEYESESKPRRFTPPTIAEVKAYCDERKNTINPEAFIDYYTANGWKVGKNPMKDWKAAVRQWERTEKPKSVPKLEETHVSGTDEIKRLLEGM